MFTALGQLWYIYFYNLDSFNSIIKPEEGGTRVRIVFIILMILLAIAVVAVAVVNHEIVTVDYLFGQVELTLFTVMLGSALAGVLIMVFFYIYRSIHNYLKSGSDRALKKELQQRIKYLESENKKLEEEAARLQKERENAAEKARKELETEKNKLEEELERQRKGREEASTREQAELQAEKEKLEEELRKQQKEQGSPEEQDETESPPKKGFWDFLKRK